MKKKRPQPKPRRQLTTPSFKTENGECVTPGAMPEKAISKFLVKRDSEKEKSIRSYVEWQTKKDKEKVTHLEKVATESIFGEELDAWSVHTSKSKWWVITAPMMNLYSQQLFPSLDYTISFHIGLMTRLEQDRITSEQAAAHDSVNQLWNKISRIHASLFDAKRVEDFQAIGMKCRECLLLLIKRLADVKMVPAEDVPPQTGNFVQWSDVVAQAIAGGGSNERIRGHLKDISKSTWQLVNWLTHAQNASKQDGAIAISATENVLEVFMMALVRSQKQSATPRKNPSL